MPEVWITIAEAYAIPDLRLTTRDIADYDELMQHRLSTLRKHDLKMSTIADRIAEMRPLPGAGAFLKELRRETQVIILSDTFTQFWQPMAPHLDYPTVFCNTLRVVDDRIVDYYLRVDDGKRRSVEAFHGLGFRTVAVGDSFNDITMLRAADTGVLFSPSEQVRRTHGDLPVASNYAELHRVIRSADGTYT
jgi:phosphoserine/homoserine phosphotransferase